MELWIRSQDEMKLVKVNYIYAMEGNDYFTIYGETIDSGPIIAKYKTKERALEVLDEIQENIVKQGQAIILTDGRGIPNGNKFFSYVYEMPKE